MNKYDYKLEYIDFLKVTHKLYAQEETILKNLKSENIGDTSESLRRNIQIYHNNISEAFSRFHTINPPVELEKLHNLTLQWLSLKVQSCDYLKKVIFENDIYTFKRIFEQWSNISDKSEEARIRAMAEVDKVLK
mgnify:CR=1 FL=1|jgi:hypothetical protein